MMASTRWLLFILVCALHPLLYGQDVDSPSPRKLGWVRLGVGAGVGPQLRGMALDVAASYLTSDGVFSIRYGGVGTMSFESVTPQLETEGVGELSAMYGLSYQKSILHMTASTGLGVVRVSQTGPSGRHNTLTVGIPLDFQVMITPFRVIGWGVGLSGNLNPKQSYASVLIGIQLGLLR